MTFLALLLAALIAWRQVREARRLREEQARPFVIIDFNAWQTIVEVTITNAGATLARDVRFEFDQPFVSTHDGSAGREDGISGLSVFKNGISSLAPGKEIRLFFDQFPARVQADLPMTYDVSVSYRDGTGRMYSEPQVLDLQMYLGTGGITRYGLHDIHAQLKKIAQTLERWSDKNGVKIVTAEDRKRRAEEFERELAEEREAAEQARGGTDDSDAGPDFSGADPDK